MLPESALFLPSLTAFRRETLETSSIGMLALLGPGAFEGIGGEVVRVALIVLTPGRPSSGTMSRCSMFRVNDFRRNRPRSPAVLISAKSGKSPCSRTRFCRMVPGIDPEAVLLRRHASSVEGMSTGDGARYQRNFWELGAMGRRVDPISARAN